MLLTNIITNYSYLAPEFLMHGIVDEKTDVFALGVLLLELVTGRRALDYSQQSLVLWVCSFLFHVMWENQLVVNETMEWLCVYNFNICLGKTIVEEEERRRASWSASCWQLWSATDESCLVGRFFMHTTIITSPPSNESGTYKNTMFSFQGSGLQ